VQLGGILLTTLGALGVISSLLVAGLSFQETLGKVLEAQGDAPLPGGQLNIRVLDNGTPAAASVRISTPLGVSLGSNQTHAGWANLTLGRHAIVNITVTSGSHVLQRHAFVTKGQQQNLTLDVARDAPQDPRWVGLDELFGLLRIVVIVFGVICLLLLGSGIAALAVRFGPLAVGGPLPALALALYIMVATLNVGALVVLALLVVGTGFVYSGRAAFRQRR
jgi:hypothetical protein